jgi:tetratricopeptide (TPR) repeat protein
MMGENGPSPCAPPWEQPEPEPGDELDFFVSYAADDVDWARWIAEQLEGEGFRVRYQHRDLHPGGTYPQAIDKDIERARRVIVVVSSKSLESSWVRAEWDAAGNKVLPIRIESVDIPGLRGNRTYSDLFGQGVDDDRRREMLLEAVAGVQPMTAVTPDLPASIELPARETRFSGRESLLRRIFSHLQTNDPKRGTRLTLAGISGVGKTILAVEYGHRMLEHGKYKHVWFIEAGNRTTLEAGLRAVVAELQLPRPTRTLAGQVGEALGRTSSWLLILDDADRLDSIAEYLPSSTNGHVLITSDNPSTWGKASVIEVEGWSDDEAIDFLVAQAGTMDRHAALQLARELDGHPGRLTYAASVIDRTGISVTSYLERYRDAELRTRDRFAATLAVAIDELQSNALALATVRLGSFLGPERVPIELLVEGLRTKGHDIDEVRFDDEAIEPLLRFALIRRDDPYLIFSRLLQSEVRASAAERGETAEWTGAALTALDHLYPQTRDLRDPAVWSRAVSLLPHVLFVTNEARKASIDLASVGRLMIRAALFFQTAEHLPHMHSGPRTRQSDEPPSQRSPQTETLLREARRILEEVHGRDHLDVAEAAAAIGAYHRERHELDKARAALAEAHEISVRAAGSASIDTAARLTELARVERDLGHVGVAIAHLEEATRIAETAGEEGKRVLADALASRGIALARRGHNREALQTLDRSVSLFESIFGTEHIEVASTLASVSAVRDSYGDTQGAQAALDRMLQIERDTYGADSPFRAPGLVEAANRALARGDTSRADAMAAEIHQLIGDDPVAGDVTLSWAYLIQSQAARQSGSDAWRELLDRASIALQAAHLPDVTPRLTLVDYLLEDGHDVAAMELAAQVTQELIQEFDWRNAAVALTAESVATAASGKLTEATGKLRSLLEMVAQHPEIEVSVAATTRLRLSAILAELGRETEALEVSQTTYEQAIESEDVITQADALVQRSSILLRHEDVEGAVGAAKAALDLRTRNLIAGNPLIVEARLAVARAEGRSGRVSEARTQLEAAVAETAARFGAQSLEVGLTYVQVAESLAILDRAREAARRAEQGLRIRLNHATGQDERIRATIDAGYLMLQVGDLPRAHDLVAQARRMTSESAPVQRQTVGLATELGAHVALRKNDLPTASTLTRELIDVMQTDPDISPRLKASAWLLYADVHSNLSDGDLVEALHALNEVRALGVDLPGSPRQHADLRAAELLWYLNRNEEAIDLARLLVSDVQDDGLRLRAYTVLIPALVDAGRGREAEALLGETASLFRRDLDPLLPVRLRIRLGGAHRRSGNDAAARVALDEAASELRGIAEITDPPRMDEVGALFEELAFAIGTGVDPGAGIEALENAADLYRRSGDERRLANVMDALAVAALEGGDSAAVRRWLDEIEGLLPVLERDVGTIVIKANVGLRYMAIGDFAHGREALEQAIAEYVNLRGIDEPDLALILAPLVECCDEVGDHDAAEAYATRAVECSPIDEEHRSDDVVGMLYSLARERVGNEVRFDRIVGLAEQLAEQRLDEQEQADLYADLAALWASDVGWDHRSVGLLDAANDHLLAAESFSPELAGRIAVLHSNALFDDGQPGEAEGTLTTAVEQLREAGDSDTLLDVLFALGELRMAAKRPAEAAAAYEEAATLYESVAGGLAEQLQLLTALGRAHIQAGNRANRASGIRQLRDAAHLAETRQIPREVAVVNAMSWLASSLAQDAEDLLRASSVLRRAMTVNEELLASKPPEAGGLPSIVQVVQALEGTEAAVALVLSAITQAPEDANVLQGVITLVVDAGLTADVSFELVASAGAAPSVVAVISSVLANVFDSLERREDARVVLRRALEHLRNDDGANAKEEVELLFVLDELDDSEDQTEALAALRRAAMLAAADPELADYEREIQARLGRALFFAGQDEQAVRTLAPVADVGPFAGRTLGASLINLGRHRDAADTLNGVLAAGSDARTLALLATAENRAGQPQAAFDTIDQAFAEYGPIPELLVLCADICNELAEYNRAVEYAEAAAEVAPGDPVPFMKMAWAFEHLGPTRGAECEAAFDRALELGVEGSDRLYALTGRAGARQVQGQPDEARSDYEQVHTELVPGSDWALEAWVLYNLGEYERALAAYAQASEESNEPSIRFDRALCQLVGGFNGGLEAYLAVLDDVNQLDPRHRLAPLRVARNDLRDARVVHDRLGSDAAFRRVIEMVEASLSETEPLVVHPIFTPIPPIDLESGRRQIDHRPVASL